MKKKPKMREYLCHISHYRPGRKMLYTDTEWYAASSQDELCSIIKKQYADWGLLYSSSKQAMSVARTPATHGTNNGQGELAMEKEQVLEIMHRHIITGTDEAERAMEFVREMLEGEAKHLELTEPHAYMTISRLEAAASEVGSLLDDVYQLQE